MVHIETMLASATAAVYTPSGVAGWECSAENILRGIKFCENLFFSSRFREASRLRQIRNLLASLNLLEIKNHDDARYNFITPKTPPPIFPNRLVIVEGSVTSPPST
jgi:hypothetical protein